MLPKGNCPSKQKKIDLLVGAGLQVIGKFEMRDMHAFA
jgi:hypothetical protein